MAKVYYDYGEGKKKDLIQTRETIKNLYPDYLEAYDKVLSRNNASYCNMFVMSADNTKKYCAWLFDILFDVESKTDLSGYTVEEKRIYGYISEILLNVWVEKNSLKVKYLPIAYMQKGWKEQLKETLRNVRRKSRCGDRIIEEKWYV